MRDIQLISTLKRRADAEPTPEPADEQPRELLVVNLLAQNGRRFAGEDVVNASDAECGVAVTAAIEALYRSAASGKPESVA